MRVRAEAEVRFQPPVFQIVQRFKTRPREVRDLVAMDAQALQFFDRGFIKLRRQIVGGNIRRAVALAVEQHLAAQAAVFVDFEHVDGNMRRVQLFDPSQGFAPARQRLARQAGDQIDIDVGQSPLRAACAISSRYDFRRVLAAGARQFARNEGLHAQAHAIHARARPTRPLVPE